MRGRRHDPCRARSANDLRERLLRRRWLGFADPATLGDSSDWRVAIAGYSGDLNEGSQITMDWGCKAQVRAGLWLYDCHTWRGSSGSPIIIVNRKTLRSTVVGVNAAMQLSYDAPGKGATKAVRLGAASPELFVAIAQMSERHKAEDAAAKK